MGGGNQRRKQVALKIDVGVADKCPAHGGGALAFSLSPETGAVAVIQGPPLPPRFDSGVNLLGVY